MTQLYSTGPASVWLRFVAGQSSGSDFLLLGWGERAPAVHVEPFYRPISYDHAGEAPASRMLVGETISVSVTLVRYNMTTLRLAQTVASSSLLSAAGPGQIPPGGIGSILDLEGGDFQLIVYFPYAAKPVFQNADNGAMPRGYFVPHASLDPQDVEPGSTTPKKVRLGFTGLPGLDMSVTNAFGTGQLSAYSTADADLAPVVGLPWN